MPVSVDIDDRGLASLAIADPQGEIAAYSFRILQTRPVYIVEVTRADTGQTYRVEEQQAGRLTCDCPAQKYRKRGTPACKHCLSIGLFVRWLRDTGRQLRALPQQRSIGA